MFCLIINWVPVQERPMAMAVMEVGSSIGTIVLYFSSGFIVQAFTWTGLFYMPAIVSLVLAVAFVSFIRNTPEDHPLISEEELNHIHGKEITRNELEMSHSDGKASPADNVSMESYESEVNLVVQYAIPWRKMLTNKSVLSLFLFKLARTMVFHFINSKIPHYLKHVLKEDIVSVGVSYAIFTGIMFMVILSSAKISEAMIVKGWISRTNCRRAFSLVSGFATAFAFMMIPTLQCNIVGVKVFFYFCAIGVGCGMASDVTVPPEMSSNFSAILYALCNMCHVIPGFVSPMFAGFVLGQVEDEWVAWKIIFYTIGCFLIFANVIFLIFIRAKRQDFDEIKEPPRRDSRIMSVVSIMSNYQSQYV
jgi:sugar phosphate permease